MGGRRGGKAPSAASQPHARSLHGSRLSPCPTGRRHAVPRTCFKVTGLGVPLRPQHPCLLQEVSGAASGLRLLGERADREPGPRGGGALRASADSRPAGRSSGPWNSRIRGKPPSSRVTAPDARVRAPGSLEMVSVPVTGTHPPPGSQGKKRASGETPFSPETETLPHLLTTSRPQLQPELGDLSHGKTRREALGGWRITLRAVEEPG